MRTIVQYDETERASSSAACSSAALTAFGRRIVSVPSFSIAANVRHLRHTNKQGALLKCWSEGALDVGG